MSLTLEELKVVREAAEPWPLKKFAVWGYLYSEEGKVYGEHSPFEFLKNPKQGCPAIQLAYYRNQSELTVLLADKALDDLCSHLLLSWAEASKLSKNEFISRLMELKND